MNLFVARKSVFKWTLLSLLLLPSVAGAQNFTDGQEGDVNAGFRKTGSHAESYELVVYLGNISNFMTMPAGASTNFTFYTNQLAYMCHDGLGNLQWSAFASFTPVGAPLTNSGLVWPNETCWYTLPRANAAVQTTAPARLGFSAEGTGLQQPILGVSSGANALSQTLAVSTNNNSQLVLEPVADASDDDELTYHIGDTQNPGLGSSFGDFGGVALDYSVENITSNTFATAAVSDFYVNVPEGRGTTGPDPISGQSTGNCDYLGYFTFNLNGTLTFTRASAVSAPSAGMVTGSVTNGFGPLTVIFSNTSSGSITNWVWNFGNGTIITNTTAVNVTNTYNVSGSYTVTLTVYGAGGSASYTVANYIIASAKPKLGSVTASAGKLKFSGSNCPAGVQYRILTSTNVAAILANWTPVYTNTFASDGSFAFTNTISSTNNYFIMVSP